VKLSVIVITKNEEAMLARCLQSVRFADEIVVVDSGSTDRTVDIARECGARVVVTEDWPGFGPQKNRALDLAGGEWVLSLDADEWVEPPLADELRACIASSDGPDAYELPRSSSFCGREMRHSGWWPDHILRLFRRGTARFSEDIVHERVVASGPVGRLTQPLRHESFVTLHEVVDKMNRYSTGGAEMRVRRGKGGSVSGAVFHGLWAFLRTYVFRAGFLDGREGFVLAVANAEGTYYRYLKAWLARRDRGR
jgi:glycosyltransferase involved in cell wall biosynthesis